MMEETYLVDHIKERVCFVSTDIAADFARTKRGELKLEYVLPDGVKDLTGYVRQPLPPGERRDVNAHEQVGYGTLSSLALYAQLLSCLVLSLGWDDRRVLG
jgi:Actin